MEQKIQNMIFDCISRKLSLYAMVFHLNVDDDYNDFKEHNIVRINFKKLLHWLQ